MGGYLRVAAVPAAAIAPDGLSEAGDVPSPPSAHREALRRALSHLPAAHRDIIVARYAGASNAQVARSLRTSSQVINTLVGEALSWLRNEIRATPHRNHNPIGEENPIMTNYSQKPQSAPVGGICALSQGARTW
jgi:DNA-directed RNA polymerase specialized sigma24 family protein